jgi:hypothetical protein
MISTATVSTITTVTSAATAGSVALMGILVFIWLTAAKRDHLRIKQSEGAQIGIHPQYRHHLADGCLLPDRNFAGSRSIFGRVHAIPCGSFCHHQEKIPPYIIQPTSVR